MRPITMTLFAATWALASGLGLTQVRAQQAAEGTQIEVQSPAPVATTPNVATYADKRLAYDMHRRDELQGNIRRTRNALIGTSAAFAVGLALTIPAWAGDHCVTITNGNNVDDLSCDTTGKVLLGVGSPFLIGGGIGMMVSGIMLGVRKGKLRRTNERIMLTAERRVRWDPSASRFVF